MNDSERYEEVCKPAFDRIDDRLDEILTLAKSTDTAIRGEGDTKGLRTQVDRNSFVINGLLWAVGVIAAALIGIGVMQVFGGTG
jgi:hypothetical protein